MMDRQSPLLAEMGCENPTDHVFVDVEPKARAI
jgi:hypothetical protein